MNARFIVDEHIPSSAVEWLRTSGHDVVRSVDAVRPGATDFEIVEYSGRNDRIIITLDRDFLYLYPRAENPFSAIVIRTHPATPAKIQECLERLFSSIEVAKQRDAIIVVTDNEVRIHNRL